MGNLTKNFGTDTDPNLCCPCCGQCKMDEDHMSKIQWIRDEVGIPMPIVEGGGYRCDLYDQSKAGAHKEGKATDFGVNFTYYYKILDAAFQIGITGIGIKNKGSGANKEFQLHLDSAEEVPGKRSRPVIWTY